MINSNHSNMNPFIDMDVESLFTTFGEKYTHEIELLTQIIEFCMIEGLIYEKKNKEMLILSLKRRMILNCKIEKYQNVLDDAEILIEFKAEFDEELVLSWIQAKFALILKESIDKLEQAQNKYGHDFKARIRNMKSFDIREWLEEDE